MTFGALEGPEATTQRTQTMKLHFTKMQGLGNDFVVLDGVRQRIDLSPAQLRFLADRKFGIGCDQILLVEAAPRADVDFRYRIFNADGGEVEQCGNGARCFARFVFEQGLSDKREIRVETKKGIITPRLEDDGMVTVDMGVPVLAPAEVPFVSDSDAWVQPLDVAGTSVAITAVSMGNPHAVQVVADVDAAPVAEHEDVHVESRYQPEPQTKAWNEQPGSVMWEQPLAAGALRSSRSIRSSSTQPSSPALRRLTKLFRT